MSLATTHPNLLAAWTVLLADNVPVQVRPDPAATLDAAVAGFYGNITAEDVNRAEEALGLLRQPGDTGDIESPLWQVCSGDPSDCEAAVANHAGVLKESLHCVLEELFEATGPAAQVEHERLRGQQ